LGKLAALLAFALILALAILLVAAAAGAVLSDYEGVKTVTHHEREVGLIASAVEQDGLPVKSSPDLRRLGFTGRWDDGVKAYRIERVLPGSLSEARQLLPGDIVTHAAAGPAGWTRLQTHAQWLTWVAALPDGSDLRLKVDNPIETPNRDFTADYLLNQTFKALRLLPFPLLALVCFGLLWSTLVDGAGPAVGGTLLSFLALKYVTSELVVSVARLAHCWSIQKVDIDRLLFTKWLDVPMTRLQGAATATANMEILVRDVKWSTAVCAATALICLSIALWRFRRKDIL